MDTAEAYITNGIGFAGSHLMGGLLACTGAPVIVLVGGTAVSDIGITKLAQWGYYNMMNGEG